MKRCPSRFLWLALSSAGLGGALLASGPQQPSPTRFEKDVRPVIATYCLPCHSGTAPAGKVSLVAKTDDEVRAAIAVWERAAGNLRSKRMPPPGALQPTDAQRTLATEALEAVLSDCRKTDPGRVTLRRLNRSEYDNTIRDLVGVDFKPAGDFPSDDVGYGFDNIGDVLSLSPLLMEKYLAAAEQIAERAIRLPVMRTLRFEGEDLRSANAGTLPNGERVLSTNGSLVGERTLALGGPYKIRVRAYGQQAGPEPAKMSVLLDDRPVATFEVRAVRSAPTVIEVPVTLQPGRHQFGAAFLNDYYQPNAANPADRDRNLIVEFIEVVGPLDGGGPLPASHTRLVTAQPNAEVSRDEATRRVIAGFATRAFRRPATPDEVARLSAIAKLAEREGESFERGVQLAVTAALTAPQFLFRVELDPPSAGAVRNLSGFETASRLSYFLWSSMPDARLFSLAASGDLAKPAVRAAEVARMLKDPKAAALADNFADQWLQLRKLEIVSPDPTRFPPFDTQLRDAMRAETLGFFRHVVEQDRSVLDFLDAPYTFLNERLAKHYGISGVIGPEFRKVSTDGVQRAGVLTHASVLTVTSNPTRTSPVKRGKWILELLGTPPPPPPPGVDDLKDSEAVTGATLRQMMETHRKNPACASCHAKMDPLGFGLENFDAVGRWRAKEGVLTIDASGVLPDGSKFKSPAELRATLRKGKDQFVHALAEKLLTYALGRGLTAADRCAIDTIVSSSEKGGFKMSALIQGVVESEPFLKRRT